MVKAYDLRKKIKRAMPWVTYTSTMRKSVLQSHVDQIDQLKEDGEYLVNDGRNSCYLDSLWVAMFAPSLLRKWVSANWLNSKHAVELRNTLRKIYTRISESTQELHMYNRELKSFTCTNVRGLLIPHAASTDVEWLRAQNDPNDVLQALINAFHQKPDVLCTRTSPSRTHMTKVLFNSIMVGTDLLYNKKRVVLKRHIFKKYNENDRVKLEIDDAKCLYIPVLRNFMGEQKLTTRVYASETVTLNTDIEMELCSIILHLGSSPNGGHYTCCFKRSGKWYYYDDLKSTYKLMDTIKTDLVRKNATAFVYAKL